MPSSNRASRILSSSYQQHPGMNNTIKNKTSKIKTSIIIKISFLIKLSNRIMIPMIMNIKPSVPIAPNKITINASKTNGTLFSDPII